MNIYVKELAHEIIEAESPKSAGRAIRLETQGKVDVAVQVQRLSVCWQNSLLFREGSLLFLQLIGRGPPTLERDNLLTQSLLI